LAWTCQLVHCLPAASMLAVVAFQESWMLAFRPEGKVTAGV
jgi:hypothetical protein